MNDAFRDLPPFELKETLRVRLVGTARSFLYLNRARVIFHFPFPKREK